MGSEFYKFDRCLGDTCTINGKNAYSSFNADLKELNPVAGSISTDFSRALGMSGFSISSYEFKTGGIKAVFYVGGSRREECFMHTSNLIAECSDCIIKTDRDKFEYVAVLTSYGIKETGVDFYNEVTLTFSVIKRFPLITHTFSNANGSFKNVGSIASGMRLTIISNVELAEFTVNEITITNMPANLPFIIDGLAGEVKCNGINRFLDTDLIEFPKVNPGENTITVSANVTVEVSYYPTFIT